MPQRERTGRKCVFVVLKIRNLPQCPEDWIPSPIVKRLVESAERNVQRRWSLAYGLPDQLKNELRTSGNCLGFVLNARQSSTEFLQVGSEWSSMESQSLSDRDACWIR